MTTRADEAAKRKRPSVPLSRTRIVATAVRIADEHGIQAVTMRGVASRLGAEAMSLYNHVANKSDILDGMVDRVIEQIDLPDAGSDWRKAMRRRAVSARVVFRRHPWAPALVDSRPSSGPSRLRYFDRVLGTLLGAGFTIEHAARAFSLLDSYVYGFGIQQFNFSAGPAVAQEQRAEAILAAIPAETYPHLQRMASHATRAGYDAEADFEFGLEVILDGLARTLDPSAAG